MLSLFIGCIAPMLLFNPCDLQVVQCSNQINATVYAYNSEVNQTDSSPFITASGHRLGSGDRVVANNCLPFGTVVEIAGIDYTVLDRMHSRYSCSDYDIWLESKQEALQWGVRRLKITVLE